MKKRSLVAALAMLMVSAIVLTSSTYAWFATSSSAKAEGFSANVTNNKGSLTLQATGGNAVANPQKKVTLTDADYTTLATTLTPVSLYIDNGVKAKVVTYESSEYKSIADAAANTDFLQYSFNVEYVNGGEAAVDVQMTPKWNTTDTQPFCYALVEVGEGEAYYFFNYSGDYVPVSALSDVVTDDGSTNDIIDAEDTGADTYVTFAQKLTATDKVTAVSGTTTNSAITLFEAAASATTSKTVTVYVWAEGQDAQCSGTVTSFASYLDLDFAAI